MLKIEVEYKELSRKINQFAVATGRTREDVCRQALKGMVTYAVTYTPPASKKATGKDAQYQGQAKIMSDLNKMGFRPVDLKDKRPENPLFADPDAFHHAYLAGNAIKTLFFVSRPKFQAMVARLFLEIGKLCSGWIPAAVELGVSVVPAWIYRHAGEGRGEVQLQRQGNITMMKAINHVPDNGKLYYAMLQLKAFCVRYAGSDLDRQLKAKLAGQWGK